MKKAIFAALIAASVLLSSCAAAAPAATEGTTGEITTEKEAAVWKPDL